MGFWDKVKSAGSALTGGSADVKVFVNGEPVLGEPFHVTISAQMKGDLKVNRIYLLMKAWEEVKADGIEIEYENGQQEIEREMVHKIVDTFNTEIDVDGAQELETGETYEWTVEVNVPTDYNGTYRGVHARHEWQLYAGLDAFGNDPDSGWVGFEIY